MTESNYLNRIGLAPAPICLVGFQVTKTFWLTKYKDQKALVFPFLKHHCICQDQLLGKEHRILSLPQTTNLCINLTFSPSSPWFPSMCYPFLSRVVCVRIHKLLILFYIRSPLASSVLEYNKIQPHLLPEEKDTFSYILTSKDCMSLEL